MQYDLVTTTLCMMVHAQAPTKHCDEQDRTKDNAEIANVQFRFHKEAGT